MDVSFLSWHGHNEFRHLKTSKRNLRNIPLKFGCLPVKLWYLLQVQKQGQYLLKSIHHKIQIVMKIEEL